MTESVIYKFLQPDQIEELNKLALFKGETYDSIIDRLIREHYELMAIRSLRKLPR